jgi:Domain of unknown function (DUF4396)
MFPQTRSTRPLSRSLSSFEMQISNRMGLPPTRIVSTTFSGTLSQQSLELRRRHSSCSKPEARQSTSASLFTIQFWQRKSHWKRASLNTFRCLAGCTLGDFSAMWMLQSHFPYLGIAATMGLSSKPADSFLVVRRQAEKIRAFSDSRHNYVDASRDCSSSTRQRPHGVASGISYSGRYESGVHVCDGVGGKHC